MVFKIPYHNIKNQQSNKNVYAVLITNTVTVTKTIKVILIPHIQLLPYNTITYITPSKHFKSSDYN